VGNEGRKGGIEDRFSSFPPQDNGFFIVIEAFFWAPTEVGKGVLMPSNQGVKISFHRKADILPSRETQHIRETLHFRQSRSDKRDFVGTPIALALTAWFRLKADDGLILYSTDGLKILSENRNTARIPFVFQFFE
jgi:hypothetical protein